MLFKKRPFPKKTGYYNVPQVDLSVKPQNTPEELEYLFENTIVDNSTGYLGHPDSVLLNNGDILTVYPKGHGKGAVLSKISDNGGISYDKEIENQPVSWEKSLETPTVYRLQFRNGNEKLILISANSKWPGMSTLGGFNSSISLDEGKSWTEFKRFWDNDSEMPLIPIVAMASLTRLK
ncbi:MAG: exo-alpha-sialidase [Clostridia bacterium]|nr:exo-alpha-sialidase [Clostridia bacterium]